MGAGGGVRTCYLFVGGVVMVGGGGGGEVKRKIKDAQNDLKHILVLEFLKCDEILSQWNVGMKLNRITILSQNVQFVSG